MSSVSIRKSYLRYYWRCVTFHLVFVQGKNLSYFTIKTYNPDFEHNQNLDRSDGPIALDFHYLLR